MSEYISDIAFSPSVKEYQEKEGSRYTYQRVAESRDWQHSITDQLRSFIANRDSFYMATVNQEGQPYIQHRGGPKGFLKVLDDHTLGFADFSGNRQYISAGNLQDSKKVSLFLMDYPSRSRIKIWGDAKIIEKGDKLIDELKDNDYKAIIERAMITKVKAWDVNCPQHIPPRYTLDELEPQIGELKERIKELEVKLESCEPKSEK
jgi:predicted pyridoxine 5'-phosphate oxidase superfamily flavin-nucleotide-binding protein